MTVRFGSFITTFNRPNSLIASIEALRGQTRQPDVLLVVDNGSNPETRALVAEYDGVVYEDPGDNLGSAGGTAHGMELLHAAGCDWIHSIDDDQPPETPDTIERMLAVAERHAADDVGAVAATGTLWDWRTGQTQRIPDADLHGDIEIDVIGGSNQLTVHRRVIDDIGPPEKRFFFGFYDPLYSLRMKQAGYSLWIDGDLMREYRQLTKRIGYEQTRSFVPRDPDYAIWRRYYVTRNYIHRMTRTFNRPDLARREAARALARSAGAWTRGVRYGSAFTSLQVRGIVDGYRGALGRRVEPVRKPTAD